MDVREIGRTIGLSLVVALATAATWSLVDLIHELLFRPDLASLGGPAARWLFGTALTLPFVLVALLVIGAPATFLLAKTRREGPISYAAAGVVGGLAFWPLFGVVASGRAWWGPTALLVETGACGMLAATLWWFLLRRRRGASSDASRA